MGNYASSDSLQVVFVFLFFKPLVSVKLQSYGFRIKPWISLPGQTKCQCYQYFNWIGYLELVSLFESCTFLLNN